MQLLSLGTFSKFIDIRHILCFKANIAFLWLSLEETNNYNQIGRKQVDKLAFSKP